MAEQFDKQSSIAKLASILGLSEEEAKEILHERLPSSISPMSASKSNKKSIPLFQCKIIAVDQQSYSVFVPSTGWLGVLNSATAFTVGETVVCRYMGKEGDRHMFLHTNTKSNLPFNLLVPDLRKKT